MITPTGVTVAEYWNAICSNNASHCRITYNDGIVLDETDVEMSGISIMDIINGEIDLTIGAAVMKTLNMRLFVNNKTRNIVWGSEFTLEFGIEVGGTTNWITVGTFVGERPEQFPVNDVFEVVAYDRMQMFDIDADDFIANLTYPVTFGNMYHALCTYVGIQYDSGDELANIMNRSFPASVLASGMTCRDILGLMAEACGCYARITPSGHVKMVWFSDESSYSVPANEEFNLSAMNIQRGRTWEWMEQYTWADLESMTWNDIATYNNAMTIDALSVKSSNDDIGVIVPSSGTRNNVYYIIDNPFLYNETDQDVTNYIQPIYTRLNAFGSYLPMSVECTGNWLVESGDIITVDFNGESIKLPIFARTMYWKGTCKDTYEATGRLQRDSMSVPTHEKLTQMGRFHEIKVTIDGNYERIQDQFGNYYTKSETATYVSTQLSTALGDYYTKTETATYVSTQMSTALGDYYTKTETASYVSTQMSTALGDYYTKTETATQISTYVGNHAYEIVSGISINSSGVTITGSKYISLDTNGYVDVGQCRFSNSGFFYEKQIGQTYMTGGFAVGSTGNAIVRSNSNVTVDPNLEFGYAGGAMFHAENGYCVFSGDGLVPAGQSGFTKLSIGYGTAGQYQIDQAIIKYIYWTNHCGQLSSRDIKHGIHNLEDVSSKVKNLNPVRFVYDSDENEEEQVGLIYEDTVNIIPEVCFEKDGRKAIDYIKLVPFLLKEIQRLQTVVEELQNGGH